MQKVRIDELDRRMSPASRRIPVAKALETEGLALNYFELAPGESFAFGYHCHHDQEEVFYIQEGAATFDTEDGEIVVEEGEAIRFAPGDHQQGFNYTDDRVVALAIGSPKESNEIDLYGDCESCDGRTPQKIEMVESRDALVTVCQECGDQTGRYT
ncbi:MULTISPECIES: cupin domain-containing protein [unclassified Haladaptatus]|uniref:cupin domain-containing protein n=1 Tax=unclassified Haladaptatus TaxID=2622732 RepID=UPI0023E80581|nr:MULTISPECIES: cupin domain-containing protein [unclassified Haladaptatus]